VGTAASACTGPARAIERTLMVLVIVDALWDLRERGRERLAAAALAAGAILLSVLDDRVVQGLFLAHALPADLELAPAKGAVDPVHRDVHPVGRPIPRPHLREALEEGGRLRSKTRDRLSAEDGHAPRCAAKPGRAGWRICA
jgi:hypothetical protein